VSISVAQAQLFFLALTRILATIVHIPVLGGRMVPNQIKIGLGLMLTLFLIPWQNLPAAETSLGLVAFVIEIGKELIIGTVAGFATDLVFGVLQMAGEAMGYGSGFSSSRVFNPAMGEAGSSLDQLFILTATLYFLVIDGHHVVIMALQKMFEIIPLRGAIPFSDPTVVLQMTSQMIQAGIHLALPLIAALLLTDLSLGLLARITPQIQVYFLGLPLKIGVSLLGMGLVLVMVLPMIGNIYKDLGMKMLMLLER
jgi:flagellar biosynthetic protein FliR